VAGDVDEKTRRDEEAVGSGISGGGGCAAAHAGQCARRPAFCARRRSGVRTGRNRMGDVFACVE
jgi:hypothetical protein